MRAQGVDDRIPFLPAVGNQEYPDRWPVHCQASFTLPKNGPECVEPELDYSCEDNDIVSRSARRQPREVRQEASEDPSRLARSGRAALEGEMAAGDVPSPGLHLEPTRENPEIGETWVELFDRLGVDLVLQGHDHA